MKHLTEEQLFALVDGGIAPNQEESIRSHLSGCAECRTSLEEIRELAGDLAPEAPPDDDAHVRNVMIAIEARRSSAGAPTSPERSGTSWRRRWLPVSAVALASAAAVGLFVGGRHHETALGDFAPRGVATGGTPSRDVGIRV